MSAALQWKRWKKSMHLREGSRHRISGAAKNRLPSLKAARRSRLCPVTFEGDCIQLNLGGGGFRAT